MERQIKKSLAMPAVLLSALFFLCGCGQVDSVDWMSEKWDDITSLGHSEGSDGMGDINFDIKDRINLVTMLTPDIEENSNYIPAEEGNKAEEIKPDEDIPDDAKDEAVEEAPDDSGEKDGENEDDDNGQDILKSAGNTVFDINGRMRGIWVATVINIDYPSGGGTADSSVLKQKADAIIDDCAALGINNIFLQVRPCSDAFYKSDIYPWSSYLTGSQGKAPSGGFDPLEYWIEKCHSKGIALHAWINPYRITKNKNEYAALSPENPAVLHPEWVVRHKENYYFNPGIPEVRELVLEGILEVVRNYDVDGIHFDDYFYPNESGENFADDAEYAAYGSGFSSKGEWRRDNVNRLVKEIGPAIKSVKPNVVFGISPSGIWANSSTMGEGSRTSGMQAYTQLYADTRRWAREEWIDYIAPQIYWEIGHNKADYAVLVDWWSAQLQGVSTKLYIGMGDYRTVDGAKGAWAQDNGVAQIQSQMQLNDSYPNISGEIHYNYGSVMKNRSLSDYYSSIYN